MSVLSPARCSIDIVCFNISNISAINDHLPHVCDYNFQPHLVLLDTLVSGQGLVARGSASIHIHTELDRNHELALRSTGQCFKSWAMLVLAFFWARHSDKDVSFHVVPFKNLKANSIKFEFHWLTLFASCPPGKFGNPITGWEWYRDNLGFEYHNFISPREIQSLDNLYILNL